MSQEFDVQQRSLRGQTFKVAIKGMVESRFVSEQIPTSAEGKKRDCP